MELVRYRSAGYEIVEPPVRAVHKISQKDKNPYDEPQHFVRGRVDRDGYKTGYSSIGRDNIVLQRKLKEIQSRSSSYAANSSYTYFNSSCSHTEQAWQSFMQHTVHTPSRGKSPQKARAQEIAACNSVMAKKLNELYAIKKDSFVVQNKLGKGVDCTKRWQQRTGIYSSSCSSAGLRSSAGSGSRPCTAPSAGNSSTGVRSSSRRPCSAGGSTWPGHSSSTGVPKTLGVALCAGCGCRSFFNADGAQLQPCPECGHAFYCSDACRQFDYASHKAECRFHTTGRWHAAGIRPSQDCWVMNRAMTAARRALQQQHKHRSSSNSRPGTAHAASAQRHAAQQSLSFSSSTRRCKSPQPGSRKYILQEKGAFEGWLEAGDQQQQQSEQADWQQQLQQQLQGVRLQEQQETLQQQQVELRATQGLDGPRPCLCSNGQEQIGVRLEEHKTASQSTYSSSGAGGSLRRTDVTSSSSGGIRHRSKTWKGVHEA